MDAIEVRENKEVYATKPIRILLPHPDGYQVQYVFGPDEKIPEEVLRAAEAAGESVVVFVDGEEMTPPKQEEPKEPKATEEGGEPAAESDEPKTAVPEFPTTAKKAAPPKRRQR